MEDHISINLEDGQLNYIEFRKPSDPLKEDQMDFQGQVAYHDGGMQ